MLWSRLRAGLGWVGCRGGRTRRRVLVGRTFPFIVVVVGGDVGGDVGWRDCRSLRLLFDDSFDRGLVIVSICGFDFE